MDTRSAEFEAVLALGNFNAKHAQETPGSPRFDGERLMQFLVREKHRLAVVRRKEIHTALAWFVDHYTDTDRQTEDKRYSLLLPFGRTHPSAPPAYSGDMWVSTALQYVAEEEEIARGGLVYYVSHAQPPLGLEYSQEVKLLNTFDGRQVHALRFKLEQTPHEDRLPKEYPSTLATHIVSSTVNDVHTELHEMEMGLSALYYYLGGSVQEAP